MADGRDEATAYGPRRAYPWTEIFRCFQVALDPRKLLVAAAGILTMSLGWYVLSAAFWYPQPDRNDAAYSNAAMQRAAGDKTTTTEADWKAAGDALHKQEVDQWRVMHDLAGPGGRLRTLPWDEYRGPNPYLLVTDVFSGSPGERAESLHRFLTGTVPVMVEPLAKLVLPVSKFIDARANTLTRFYVLLCLLWSIATWAFFGGIITRIAAVQFTGKDRVSLGDAVKFVVARYTSYLLSPVVPLAIIAVITFAMALYGLVALIPVVGDIVLYGLLMPLVFLGGLVMAILLVGLVGYPLMSATVSTEGSDTFDALSRSYNYVFQAPWSYIWYSTVAVVYGAAVTLFVVFLASMTVYLGKWAITQAPWSETSGRKPDYLFVYSPQSFGWRELFLQGTPLELKATEAENELHRHRVVYDYKYPDTASRYESTIWRVERAGAGMVTFWLILVFMLMLGFSYSYFWSAATMIYLLMRRKVDETDLDEIYLEEDLPDAPLPPPATAGTSAPAHPGATSLPTVPAPVPPAPPLPLSMSPPVSPPPPPLTLSPPPLTLSPPPVSPPPPAPTLPFGGSTAGGTESVAGNGAAGSVGETRELPRLPEVEKKDGSGPK